MSRSFDTLANITRSAIFPHVTFELRPPVISTDNLHGSIISEMSTLPWIIMIDPKDFGSGGRVVGNIHPAGVSHETCLVYAPPTLMGAARDVAIEECLPRLICAPSVLGLQ